MPESRGEDDDLSGLLLQCKGPAKVQWLVSSIAYPPWLPLVFDVFKPSSENKRGVGHVGLVHAEGRQEAGAGVCREKVLDWTMAALSIPIPDKHFPEVVAG